MKEMFSQSDMDQLLKDSHVKPILILKHSTTCPISAHAYKAFNQYVDQMTADHSPVDFAWVKVIESRPASLYLADLIGVKHQSPQVILIDKGRAVWDDSHWQITVERLAKAVGKWESQQ